MGNIIPQERIIFVQKYLDELLKAAPDIDTIMLACTHYPLLMDKIRKYLPGGIQVVSQGPIVADSLADYLHRHPEIESTISKNGGKRFYTTDDTADFDIHAATFFGAEIRSEHVQL